MKYYMAQPNSIVQMDLGDYTHFVVLWNGEALINLTDIEDFEDAKSRLLEIFEDDEELLEDIAACDSVSELDEAFNYRDLEVLVYTKIQESPSRMFLNLEEAMNYCKDDPYFTLYGYSVEGSDIKIKQIETI